MATVIVEIRSAEGGDHSKVLVRKQLTIYTKFAVHQGLDLELLDERPGMITCRLSGPNTIIKRFAQYEVGGMRWQEVSPTDKKGRVHTSTVTIAVLREPSEVEVHLDPSDLDIRACRGSGAGGQHRNTTDSAVQVTHLPTGLQVRVESERSQHQNKANALALLRAKLLDAEASRRDGDRNDHRRSQLGVGARGDKRRTIALQRDQVTDHVTGKSMRGKDYLRGDLMALWPK
jgi:peptide chain release factor 1